MRLMLIGTVRRQVEGAVVQPALADLLQDAIREHAEATVRRGFRKADDPDAGEPFSSIRLSKCRR